MQRRGYDSLVEALPRRPDSLWLATAPMPGYEALTGNVSVDVAVVGAGITGLTTAALLKEAGARVAVLESKTVGRGTTGYTTAKVTSGHQLAYAKLRKSFGDERARIYADSHEAALEWIARRVEERGIDCDFTRAPHVVYSEDGNEVKHLEQEVEAEQRVGLPASFVDDPSLPFPVAGAVRLENQAHFHPRKYLAALAQDVQGGDGMICERTRVLNVDERSPCVVHTDRGDLRARDVVVATSLPILDRGLFFTKAHPMRSYALAAPIAADRALDAMFITASGSTRSIRTWSDGLQTFLIVNGNGHKTGEEPENEHRYTELGDFMRSRFAVDSIDYRWSTHDYFSVDHVPYVGRMRKRSRHLYVATGFNGWGMAGGTMAALLLADLIRGESNPWAELYDANRSNLRRGGAKLLTENAKVGAHWLSAGMRPGTARDFATIDRGQGAIVRRHTERIAVYRDDEGRLHGLSPVCTHLACHVTWNRAEGTWDCPCHGSRFTGEGAVIQGPAVRDLQRIDLETLRRT